MKSLIRVESERFLLTHPKSSDFPGIQELCRTVYPFSLPWGIDQLRSHAETFPEGQVVCFDKATGRIVGLAFSLIISWDDYRSDQSRREFTDAGFFRNHNPHTGRTLYGAEVMTHPDYQGLGIGTLLYGVRQDLVRGLGLLRIRAGARLRGYSQHADRLTPSKYVRAIVERKIADPTLSFQIKQGFVVLDVVKDYLKNDPESLGYAAVIEWLNPAVAEARHYSEQLDKVQQLQHSATDPR